VGADFDTPYAHDEARSTPYAHDEALRIVGCIDEALLQCAGRAKARSKILSESKGAGPADG